MCCKLERRKKKMRLFNATPKSSPELVRHSQVSGGAQQQQQQQQQHHQEQEQQQSNSRPGSSNGFVTTLGRKFSRRFERLGDSEAARRLHRMASPSRKWALGEEDEGERRTRSNSGGSGSGNGRRVSRVDSFRNFLSLATFAHGNNSSSSNTNNTSTLRTPRAVKRRSDNKLGRRIRPEEFSSLPMGLSGSENTLDRKATNGTNVGRATREELSGSRSEADLIRRRRGGGGRRSGFYTEDEGCEEEEEEDDYDDYASVASEGRMVMMRGGHRHRNHRHHQHQHHHLHHHHQRSYGDLGGLSRSAGNLSPSSSSGGKLSILPENRTIGCFQNKPGIVCHHHHHHSASSSASASAPGMRIKNYGMIDPKLPPPSSSASSVQSNNGNRKASNNSHESGYSSDYASGNSNSNCSNSNTGTDSPDPSSPRASPRESADEDSSSVVNGNRVSGVSGVRSAVEKSVLAVRPVQATPPKKPARPSKQRGTSNGTNSAGAVEPDPNCRPGRDYKMVRLRRSSASEELGIIIAKRRVEGPPGSQGPPEQFGFLVVHIEPGGLIDR